MEYQEVKCRNCGNPMRVTEGARRICCPYCGTEYILKSQDSNAEKPVRAIHYGGLGALFQSYIPSGWEYRVFDDNESVSALAAVCKGLQLFPRDMSAQLLFYPFAFYKDSTPKPSFFSSIGISGLSSGGDYQLDPMSLICHCRWQELSQYAYRRIWVLTSHLLSCPSQPEVCPISGDILQQKARMFQQTASQKLQKQANVFPGKFAFRVSADGQIYKGFFATILAQVPKNPSVSPSDRFTDFLKKGAAFMGTMYGVGGLTVPDWGRAFDVLILSHTSGSAASSCEAIFDRFLLELKYAPLYFALQDEELQRAKNVQIQGAMTRQQNAIRSSQDLSRTLSETSDIVNQTCQDHSRQMNHIYDHSSDGIRGVEYYQDSCGNAYQADVKYDHIYKNGSTFVGSTDGSLQLGPDWEELKK